MVTWSRALKAVFAVVLLVGVTTFLLQAFPGVVGADHSLIVKSGSMEPTIQTGSVIFITEGQAERANEGDVITFTDDGGNLITHRVVEKHTSETSLRLVTKGDNNDVRDSAPVYKDEYVGKVMAIELPVVGQLLATIPHLGRLVAFAESPVGFMTMLWGPVLALIFSELWSLYRALEPAEEGA